MFAEEFLPVYDVSDEVATVVAAESSAVRVDAPPSAVCLGSRRWARRRAAARTPTTQPQPLPPADAGLADRDGADDPGSLVMERKMLRGIKSRAERLAAERSANPPAGRE